MKIFKNSKLKDKVIYLYKQTLFEYFIHWKNNKNEKKKFM